MSNIDVSTATVLVPARKPKGFAGMSKEQHRAIASLGGKASHTPREGKKRGHCWTKEEARLAGSKGGLASNGGKGRSPK